MYWVESGIVGLVTVAKIRRANGSDDPEDVPELSMGRRTAKSLVGAPTQAVVSFFARFYSAFWLTHGLFVFAVLPQLLGAASANGRAVVVAAVALCLSHAASYRIDYVGDAVYERTGPVTVTAEPTARLLVLHVAIVLGGIVVALLEVPLLVLVVLVVGKTAVDITERDSTSQPQQPAEHRDSRA